MLRSLVGSEMCIRDRFYKRPKFEILKVFGKTGESENPNNKWTVSSYKIIYHMYKVEIQWEDSGKVETKEMPFSRYQTHTESVGNAVITPADFHQWINQAQFFEQLFGDRYNAYLLNNEGKAFIEYLAKHNQLLPQHAKEMLDRLACARSQYERDEVRDLIMKLLKDMDASGKIAILDTVGSSLDPQTAADLLLSVESDKWHRYMNGYEASMSFVQCCVSVLQSLPPPYDQMEALNSLCVEVMTEADNTKPAEGEEAGPPLRLVLVEQSVDKIAAVISPEMSEFETTVGQSRASCGLLHMILTRAASNERELGEMLELVTQAVSYVSPDWQPVSMLIKELNTVASHPSIKPEHFSSRLMPRLTLIKLLVNVGGMRDLLLLSDMEHMLTTFADLNRLEMLLLWFSQLKLDGHLDSQQMLTVLFEWASDPAQMVSIQGFQGFKDLFIKVNASAFKSSSNGSSSAITKELGGCVTSLETLTGVQALWNMVLHGNKEIVPAAQELLLNIYFSLTLSIDHTHNALLDAIFQNLDPNLLRSKDNKITKLSVKLVQEEEQGNVRFGTKCHYSNGEKTTIWHSTAQWQQFLETRAGVTLDSSVSDSAVCQVLDEQAKSLLTSNYDDMVGFLGSGDGDLSRKPSGGITVQSSLPLEIFRLLDVLTAAVGATRDEQKFAGQMYSSRGETLTLEVSAELWQVAYNGNGDWKKLPAVSISTHATATVANLTSRVLEAHAVPHINKMHCQMRREDATNGGQQVKSSLSLMQAGFDNVRNKAVARVFPETHYHRRSVPLPSVGDAMTESDEYYNILFDLVASSSKEAATDEVQAGVLERAWRLLEVLPRSAADDEKLEQPAERAWSEELTVGGDPHSRAAWEAVYLVQSINSRLRPAQVGDEPGLAEAGLSWRRAFLHAGGFAAVYKLLVELSDCGPEAEQLVRHGLTPVMQVLDYCLEGACTEQTEHPAVLSRAFSSASKDSIKAIDFDHLLSILLGLLQAENYTVLRKHIVRALAALASSAESIAEKMLESSGSMVKELVTTSEPATAEATASLLMNICSHTSSGTVVSQVLDLTTDAMRAAISSGKAENCQYALDLLLDLLSSSNGQQLEKEHAIRMADLLKQSFADMQDEPSAKWFKLLGSLASKVSPDVLDELDLTQFIWTQLYKPSAPDQAARAATVSSLLQIVRSPKAFQEVVGLINQLHQPTLESCGEDLVTSRDYWFIDPDSSSSLRSAKGGFVGLNNQGNTCYQNSTLQQLFMHPRICEGILQADVPDDPDLDQHQQAVDDAKKANDKQALSEAETSLAQAIEAKSRIGLFKELQKLLASLKYSVSRSFNPRSFVDQAGAGKNFPFDVRMQQDASEFYSLLIDRLERAFKETGAEFKLFRDQTYLKTQWFWEATYDSKPVSRWGGPGDMDGQMIQISLLDDMGQLVPNLDAALALKLGKPEALDGITWDGLKEQTPDKKAPALDSTRTMLIKEAPPSVVFHLTRFNPFTCEKVNDRFEFGHDLDLNEYLAPDARERGDCAQYKLGGIVIQSGSAGGGHYYSFIRDRATGEWYRFDDSSVTPWNPDEDMETDCFGGVQLERITDRGGTTRHVKSQHWRTAYMLIYDRVDMDLETDQVGSSMSAEIQQEYGALIAENEKATARALVCNLGHLQLMLELMAASMGSEVMKDMLEMALPFFFSLVSRLGKSKPTYYSSSYGTNYGSTNTRYSGISSSNYTSVYSKPLEPEDDESLDELLWQWGQTLGTVIGSCEDPAAVLRSHADDIRSVMLDCPRQSTRDSVSRMLLRFASVKDQGEIVHSLLTDMLFKIVGSSQHLDQLGFTLRKVLEQPELREAVRAKEGVAQILSVLLPSHLISLQDAQKIAAADGRPAIMGKAGLLTGVMNSKNAAALCDAVCGLLSPVDDLPEVSKELISNQAVVTKLRNGGGVLTEVYLIIAGLTQGGDYNVKRCIGQIVTSLVPSPTSKAAGSSQDGREALSILMKTEWCGAVMETLISKATEFNSNKQAWAIQQNQLKVEALVSIVTELASTQPAATEWLDENSSSWAWFGQLDPSDPGLRASLQRLLATGDKAPSLDPEQELVRQIHEQLKTHGPYYFSKYEWCTKAVKTIGRCEPHDAVAWIIKNEVQLAAAERRAVVTGADAEGAAAESESLPEQSEEALVSSWQKMVDTKLFSAAGQGGSLDEMQEALDWGANLESVHVQGRHPLHNAARNNQPKAVEFLISRGADPNPSAGETGWAPLHNAVNFHGNKGDDYSATVRALLKGRADPHMKITENSTFRNRSPLDIATTFDKKQIEDIIRMYA
eukprot:TRINITY_DN1800_c0_g2_i5.p1 TRINITY_DN1800_c0_g2~~TRINITY_DN1800_c0_g2_i5.p1  ORF type:complete len:2345 (+),score=758.67 TRINITY_DN1800_c0_g2_i5:146-7036(+)